MRMSCGVYEKSGFKNNLRIFREFEDDDGVSSLISCQCKHGIMLKMCVGFSERGGCVLFCIEWFYYIRRVLF